MTSMQASLFILINILVSNKIYKSILTITFYVITRIPNTLSLFFRFSTSNEFT